MNVELLLKVKEHILNNPEKANMIVPINKCGTVGCIAGWTVLLAEPDAISNMTTILPLYGDRDDLQFPWPDVRKIAQRLLEIENHYDATSLFFYDSWPKELEKEYLTILTGSDKSWPLEWYDHNEALSKLDDVRRQELANVIGKAIDHFIKEYEGES